MISRKIHERGHIAKITDAKFSEYINAQSTKTAKTYTANFKVLLAFDPTLTGAKMLKEVEAWSRRILVFQQWLARKGYSMQYVHCVTSTVRGFFAFFRKPLDLSKQDKFKLNKRARNSEDYSPSLQDIRRMKEVSNLKESYVLIGGLSLGLRSEDFADIRYGKYRMAVERAKEQNIEPPIPLDPIETMKEAGVLAYPFISTDFYPIVLQVLESNKASADNDRVYTEQPKQLSFVLKRIAERAGINPHGQRIRFHILRKVLFSKLNSVASSEQSKMIVGKLVPASDSAYLNSDELRNVYSRVLPLISIANGMNGDARKRLAELEEENRKLREQFQDELAKRDRSIEDLAKKYDRLFEHTVLLSAAMPEGVKPGFQKRDIIEKKPPTIDKRQKKPYPVDSKEE
jgi:hypothetical protein